MNDPRLENVTLDDSGLPDTKHASEISEVLYEMAECFSTMYVKLSKFASRLEHHMIDSNDTDYDLRVRIGQLEQEVSALSAEKPATNTVDSAYQMTLGIPIHRLPEDETP
jgi:hypothetical protein